MTNLPKSLFKYISLFGEPLSELDIRNSQFAFLSYLLTDIPGVTVKFNSISEYTFPAIDTTQGDFKMFISDCTQGLLYDNIAMEFNLSRKEAKKMMFLILFSGNQFHSPLKVIFKSKYSSIYQWIMDFKRINGKEYFSIMLQKLESELFIDVIYPRLKKIVRNKDRLVVYTKHDSILMKESDYEIVKKL